MTASRDSLAAKQRFTVRGRVANRGGRASPAQLELTLRANANPAIVYYLGGARLAPVGAGRTRSFAVAVSAPAMRTAVAKGFRLRVCVRPRRGSTSVACARAADRVRVAATARPLTPAPPAPPATPPVPPSTPVPPPDTTVYSSGARTLGDSLFPTIGNGGYDAQHYDLDLTYTNILTRVLRGTTTITAVATQNLSDFSLDFQATAVTAVTVDGKPASFAYDIDASKLIVTPATGIRTGSTFAVAVVYGGSPSPVVDPDGSSEGWLSSSTLGAVALGEPLGSQGWFPVNNVPTDKATYEISITSPSDFPAVSNGRLAGATPHDDGTTTFDWVSAEPMAPYLATVSIGRFDTSGSDFRNPARPLYVYVDQSFVSGRATIVANQQRVPEILDWYAGYYGVPYPFDTAGGIVPRVGSNPGYVLETQTKPTYPSTSARSTSVPIETIAHENAHQWFGDLVTLRQWRDIWLNEGITEFSSWLWAAAQPRGTTMPEHFDAIYEDTGDGFWSIAPADPLDAADIFDPDAMYDRGATTMTAIRQIFIDTPGLGEDGFRAMMRSWLTDHAFGNVTTTDFTALVQRTDPSRAARWGEFFQQWLYTSYEGDPADGNKPSITPASF